MSSHARAVLGPTVGVVPTRGRWARALLVAAALAVWPLSGATADTAMAAQAGGGPGVAAQVERGAPPVRITLDRRAVEVSVGQSFELVSTIDNQGAEPLTGLIAHIDVLGTDPARYVDPEDWCTERTVFLDDLARGDSAAPTWQIQAVDSGPLLLWVTVTRPNGEAVAVSTPVHLTVGEHLDVNAGGVLPVVVGVPAAVLAALALVARRRRGAGAVDSL